MTLHHIEEDLHKFEEAEQETQGNLQVEGKEVEQLTGGREIIGDSVIILKQHSDKTMERYQNSGDVRDEAEGCREMNEDICRQLRRNASEETGSYVQEEITVEEEKKGSPAPLQYDLHWLFAVNLNANTSTSSCPR